VGKPFHYEELVARLRALLRRRAKRREGPRRIGELFLDPSTREVRVGGRRVELANKEFALLRALAAEPTRVFTNRAYGSHRGRDRIARPRPVAGKKRR
jgi:DNA-binding response OmpR family regulator